MAAILMAAPRVVPGSFGLPAAEGFSCNLLSLRIIEPENFLRAGALESGAIRSCSRGSIESAKRFKKWTMDGSGFVRLPPKDQNRETLPLVYIGVGDFRE
jgi:hypothetical protein